MQHFTEAKAAANLHEQGAERKWKDGNSMKSGSTSGAKSQIIWSDGPTGLRLDGPGLRNEYMNFRKWLMAMLPLTLVMVSAHPGHDLMEHGAGHVASSPYHLFVLAAVAVVMLGVAQMVRSASAKKYLRLAGATALVVAGAMWGLGI